MMMVCKCESTNVGTAVSRLWGVEHQTRRGVRMGSMMEGGMGKGVGDAET